MSPKLHLSDCLACFLSDIPARLSTQMEIHLLPAPSWLFFHFYSQPHPTPLRSLSASRSPVPRCVLIRQFILFLWVLSTICGCHSQSPCQGSIPRQDLDARPDQCCSVNPLLHIFFFPKARFLFFTFFSQSNLHRCNPWSKQTQVYILFFFLIFPLLNPSCKGQNSV